MTRPGSAFVSVLLAVALATAVAGCNRPTRPLSGFKPAPNPIEIDPAEYDRVFRAAVDVLQDAGFVVDRQDYRFGELTTRPRSSPTVFEPWRGDNTTGTLVAQSTFNNARRTVRVSLDPVTIDEQAALNDLMGVVEPTATAPAATAPADGQAAATQADAPEPDAFRLRVEVNLENLQLPTRRLTMSAHGYQSDALAGVPAEWQERGIPSAYWLPVGRDEYLEQRLIRSIVERSLELEDEAAAAE